MQKNGCPYCKNNLEMKQINFEEAVLICTNLKCPYPLDGDVKIYKRKLKDINSNIPSLCDGKEIRNCTDSNSYKSKDIIGNLSLHVEKLQEFSNETLITSECTSHPHHIDLGKQQTNNLLTPDSDRIRSRKETHNITGNDLENQKEDSENVVNIIIERATDTSSDAVNNDYDVLEIEVEIDPVSQEIIVKTVHDLPNKTDEKIALNTSCIKKIGKTDSTLDYDINNLLDAKIDELLKDADVSSIASIETMGEDIDWLNELLEP